MRGTSVKRWLARIALGSLAVVVVALLCGSAYEVLARRQLASRFPLPGRLVDIGGHRLQIDCRGAGSPTVVFEGGLGTSGALGWSLVHDQVAKTTRACAYSRAGILASDPGVGERDANAIADELHELLARAEERPPLVLVAQSLGGIYAMAYTRKYGPEVAGLVLVDASHPDMKGRMAAAGLQLKDPLGILEIVNALRWTGLIRVIVGSADAEAAHVPTSLEAMFAEAKAADRSLAQAGAFRQLDNRPLFVLTAGKLSDAFLAEAQLTPEQGTQFQAVWRVLQHEQASWSTRRQHEVVADATHHIQEDRPDRVVGATQWVVEAVRADTAR